jgi:DNA-binding response OmpR family regulator
MQAGIDAHLVKPVELDQLLTVIRTTSRSFEGTTRRSAVAGRSIRDGVTTTS